MKSFWKTVHAVLAKANVILVVLDARFVESTHNIAAECRVMQEGKPLIHVITKCDLVEKSSLEKYKQSLHPCVFVSSTEFHGLTMLRDRIFQEAKKHLAKDAKIVVGVLGYPNTGKSSLINAMTGRGGASTNKLAGWTTSMKKIRASEGLCFLDAPGVIPESESDTKNLTKMGSIDYVKTKDADSVVLALIEDHPGMIEDFYGVDQSEDPEDTVAQIAVKLKMLQKGGIPDLNRAYTLILKDWQTGKIRPS